MAKLQMANSEGVEDWVLICCLALCHLQLCYPVPVPMVHDEGICVRHWDWSETSQTVALMTRGHGLLRCLAKGSKREKAPFSGGVELLTRGGLTVIVKPNSDLATLTSWDLVEPMPGVRASYRRYAACMYVADLVPRAVHDQDPHPALYDALAGTLAAAGGVDASAEEAIPAWLAWFQWRVLEETGSKPEVGVDVVTGEVLEEGAAVGFAWDLGGLTARLKEGGQDAVARVSPSTVRVLRALDAGDAPGGLPGTGEEITRCGRALAARLRAVFGHEPPAFSLVYPEISQSSPR